MRITFLSRSLSPGGAERQLVVLAKGLFARGHQVQVITFYPRGAFEADLRESGVSLVCLEKKGRWDFVGFFSRLYRTLLREKPDILHSYLTVPNIFAVFMKFSRINTKIVWGVRASDMDLTHYDWTARLTYRLECVLSRFADLIICNSRAGKHYAMANGMPEKRIVVVPNGIDTEKFKFDLMARAKFRGAWDVSDQITVIGIVARLDPMKGYELFLRAAKEVIRKRDDIYFVCVGDGIKEYCGSLYDLSDKFGLSNKIKWLGSAVDTSKVYSGFDLLTSTSISEGFSNVIGEAMSCGLPCAVTDTGDAAYIVGDLGEIINSREPNQVVRAWERCIANKKPRSKSNIRKRILDCFSAGVLVSRTEIRLQSLSNEN